MSAQSTWGFPGDPYSKESACSAEAPGSIPGSGRSPGDQNGNPLQYSCLENPMARGARWSAVHGVAKSRTPLSDFTLKPSLKSGRFGGRERVGLYVAALKSK